MNKTSNIHTYLAVSLVVLVAAIYGPMLFPARLSGVRRPESNRAILESLHSAIEQVCTTGARVLPTNASELEMAISQSDEAFILSREVLSYRDISANIVWIELRPSNDKVRRIVYQKLPNNQYGLAFTSDEE